MLFIPKAEIRVLTNDEGGQQALNDEMRPAFDLNGDLVSGVIRTLDGSFVIPQGTTALISITFPNGDEIGLDEVAKAAQDSASMAAKSYLQQDAFWSLAHLFDLRSARKTSCACPGRYSR